MEIREITSDDSKQYYSLRVASEKEYPEFVGFNAERELAVSGSRIAELISNYPSEGTILLGAFDESQLVGVLALSRRLSQK